jgi:hypothetical protein
LEIVSALYRFFNFFKTPKIDKVTAPKKQPPPPLTHDEFSIVEGAGRKGTGGPIFYKLLPHMPRKLS